MLQRVGQQLGQAHGQRSRLVSGHRPDGTRPPQPRAGARAALGQDPVGHRVEVRRPLRRRCQGLMHHRDGGHAAARIRQGGPCGLAVRPARLHPQQRRHQLQVVLDAMVHLAQAGLAAQQGALAAAQLGDVAHQQEGTGASAPPDQRQRLQHQHRGGVLELDLPRVRPAATTVPRGRGRRRDHAAAAPAGPCPCPPDRRRPKAAEGRGGVGRGELHQTVRVQPHEAAAHPQRVVLPPARRGSRRTPPSRTDRRPQSDRRPPDPGGARRRRILHRRVAPEQGDDPPGGRHWVDLCPGAVGIPHVLRPARGLGAAIPGRRPRAVNSPRCRRGTAFARCPGAAGPPPRSRRRSRSAATAPGPQRTGPR